MQQASPKENGLDLDGENRRHTALEERIREKIADYAHYKFTVRQMRALNIFFDLAQEYEDLSYLYQLPVQVLQFFFCVKAALYAPDEAGEFRNQSPGTGPDEALPCLCELSAGPVSSGGWWFYAVKGRPGGKAVIAPPPGLAEEGRAGQKILAILAVRPETPMTGHEKLFYEKFANRVGFSLHNRLLALKNLEHIEFVRTLVHDIGHNVIVPNLHFKLLMRQMAGKIEALRRLSNTLAESADGEFASLDNLCGLIETHYQEISEHFHQSSFFLETLLRQSHFDQGRYVLQRSRFNLAGRVLVPQMERYRQRFEERGIDVEEIGTDESEFMVNADVGLVSQVMANLLSNAVKYTRETPGRKGLHVRCAVKRAADAFGMGRPGVMVEVLSSGAPIVETELPHLFAESFRASNARNEQGSGHGLYFSRLIITQHGGSCGYRRDEDGNVFYFILPLAGEEPLEEKGEKDGKTVVNRGVQERKPVAVVLAGPARKGPARKHPPRREARM